MVRFLRCEADHQQVARSDALGGFPLVAVAVCALHGAGVRSEVLTVVFLIVFGDRHLHGAYGKRQTTDSVVPS